MSVEGKDDVDFSVPRKRAYFTVQLIKIPLVNRKPVKFRSVHSHNLSLTVASGIVN